MRVLITGACGFVGSVIARELAAQISGIEIIGIDNLSRSGSELNRQSLRQEGFNILHRDVRNASDLESLPKVDWIIDAAANPSVLAGVSGSTTSRQLIEHNLIGTINLLELCKNSQCGFVMISTSRVYSQSALAELPLLCTGDAFVPDMKRIDVRGISAAGVDETFSTNAPLSLYGASKLASEVLALEYGAAFQLPVYVNRCGLLAGAGQFGKPDQGIVAFWIHAHRARKPLKYIGFEGSGAQTRDCLHPRDLASLLFKQMLSGGKHAGGIVNVSGGMAHSFSLAQLSDWCASRFGAHEIGRDPRNRPFDIPWLVLDSARAEQLWDWRPATSLDYIFNEIAEHAASHPEWLEVSRDS